MPITINYTQLADMITQDTLILTPNSRTQKSIVAGFVENLQEGEVVRAPRIMALSQWLEDLWQEISFTLPVPRLVSNLALKTWLKELISRDKDWQLTNELGVAERVLEGYRLLCLWGIDVEDIGTIDTPESMYFINWITELQSFCDSAGLLPKFGLINRINSLQHLLASFLPPKIVLVGFNELVPSETQFIEYCRQHGVVIETFFPDRTLDEAVRVELEDFSHELEFAAQLARYQTDLDSEKTVVVVVHQLASHTEQVHQVFSEVFQPEEKQPWQPLQKVRYNVSAGQALLELPIIVVAIKLLSINASYIELETLLLLKNSPFIDWGDSGNAIKRFLHRQSLSAYSRYSLDRLSDAIDRDDDLNSLSLLKARIQELKMRPSSARPMRAWSDVWKASLKSWGWLGHLVLSDAETKIVAEFHAVLNESIELGVIYPKCSQIQAKEFMLQLFKQRSFQLPSDRTNVHVLGVLEAAGLEFDRLILVGFSRQNWPQKAKSNPFLPIGLQQEKNMPGSSAEREFAYAQNLTSSLLNSSNKIWVTQSKPSDEGVSAESPLFSHLELRPATHYVSVNSGSQLAPDYEWLTDEQVDLPAGSIAGGAYLLSHYAACPFRAISNFQFKIKAPQESKRGIEAKVRGGWLHLALELIWKELKTQSALLALSDDAISELVKNKLLQSKKEFEAQLFANAPLEIIELEFDKLYQQIKQWLSFDCQRAPFSVETEVDKTLTLGELTFSFRIDRLDTNEQEGYEIIDYKTGKTDFKKWLGARPQEAQMPAYVLACQDKPVTSLSYGKIKTGEVARQGIWFDFNKPPGFRFIEDDGETLKDKTKLLTSNVELVEPDKPIIEQWHDNLEQLAIAIAAGKMPVSPIHTTETCRYCDYKDFCRIGEIQSEQALKSESSCTTAITTVKPKRKEEQ